MRTHAAAKLLALILSLRFVARIQTSQPCSQGLSSSRRTFSSGRWDPGNEIANQFEFVRHVAATKFCRSDNDFHMSHEAICCSNLPRRRVAACVLALGSVRIGKNCDLGLENAALGLRPRAAFSRPRSQFFPIRTSRPANNIYVFWLVYKARYLAWNCELKTRLSDIVSHLSNNCRQIVTQLRGLFKKFENKCKNKHEVQIKLSKSSNVYDWPCFLFANAMTSFDSWLWNGFLERAHRIKPNNIIAVSFFSYCIQLCDSRKIRYLTREFCVKLHLKTDIARIAKGWVRYRFSSAI